ncbi:hypothetical protein PU560_08550 [Georgenia sp. 10Sc9-8]|uniref:DUF1206 domain-containing protein n=1 Tax=Georgenia halotolerans TaxID=3028317 RepID=A0ABT5TZH6_9MICO|nr:hypothetical protein [Georgenia halotolerans]
MAAEQRTPIRRQAGHGLVVAGTTALWYSLPDLVASRRRRAALKAALLLAQLGYAVGMAQAGADGDDIARADASETAPRGTSPQEDPEVRVLQDRVVLTLGAVVLAVALPTGALLDRAVIRVAERMAASGVRRPHVRIGMVLGTVAGAVAVLTDDVPGSGATSPRRVG